MKINELCKQAFEDATAKGWHDPGKSPVEAHALVITEVCEAIEEVRSGTPPSYYFIDKAPTACDVHEWPPENPKPEGELIEVADAVIRLADYCGKMGWDLEQAIKVKMAYNKTRKHRHGGKLL